MDKNQTSIKQEILKDHSGCYSFEEGYKLKVIVNLTLSTGYKCSTFVYDRNDRRISSKYSWAENRIVWLPLELNLSKTTVFVVNKEDIDYINKKRLSDFGNAEPHQSTTNYRGFV